ncbi:hypothetical protein BDZ89DRAFT_1055744 [Hymenopellis radicata]|nr:hypothetical protein BDZ89DRAFT_1055744 [Hymenopellis radicata]
MARSAALNPASMPFFPGAIRSPDDEPDFSFRHHNRTLRSDDVQRTSVSSISISPSDYRTASSSPSPPQEDMTAFKNPFDAPRRSPSFRQVDATRPYPPIEARVPREASMLGSLESLPEGEDNAATPGPRMTDTSASVGSPFFPFQQSRERFATPPAQSGPNGSFVGHPTSSSPVSSSSGSHFNSTSDFEAQIKASPMIHDLLDRLIRCEYSTREIQRDLGELHRKVNVLLERSLTNNNGSNSTQPEFKDPFSGNALRRGSFTPQLPGGNMGPRPSIGNVAPNQPAPSDDITSISQRLNTLTSSVGQLLALQTQQVQTPTLTPISGLPNVTNNGLLGPKTSTPNLDYLPPQSLGNPSAMGRGHPNRPDMRPSPRLPNPPMRTWSTGTIDLPMRPPDNLGRPDNFLSIRPPLDANMGRQDGFPRDKRRSVSGLMRRDSASLSLAPELQVSLNTFGVGPPNKIQQRALPFLLRGSDIIAQAPPTQERIAAYVIPAIQTALTYRDAVNPVVLIISTTVDQATQAHRMIRDLGSTIGVRSALVVGSMVDYNSEIQVLLKGKPHIVCGTPQKLHSFFTAPVGVNGSDVRFLVLDEVDQLIARNMHEFVFSIVRLIPTSRPRPPASGSPPNGLSSTDSPVPGPVRRMSAIGTPRSSSESNGSSSPPQEEQRSTSSIERQSALFSNTVPQDVLNLATVIQLRDPVRVLVRRDGTVTNIETSPNFRGLRQFYLYLAFTAGSGLGIIGSGRSTSSAESIQAREWKLDALADILDDVEVSQAIVHVGGVNALDAVVYKLASRGLEAIPLHGDMSSATKLSALSKFKTNPSVVMRQSPMKVLVIYDVHVQEVSQIPLIINYGEPVHCERFIHANIITAPAVAPNNYTRGGVIINFVTATGGDVEMLRSIECFHK